MASVVDICNLSLSRLGDNATVSSIDPPEGSPQAQYCKNFYPLARDTMLEMHQWSFTTRRIAPSLVTYPFNQWAYAYAAPADLIDVISVMDVESSDDFVRTSASYAPQTYSLESLDDGTAVILTNQENALVRYTAKVTDAAKFPALFVDALAWLLASHLAGPLIKGEVGASTSRSCYQAFMQAFNRATAIDANNQKRDIKPNVTWVANR